MYRIFSKRLAVLFALLLGLAQLPVVLAGEIDCENAGGMPDMQAIHASQHDPAAVQHNAAHADAGYTVTGIDACQHCDGEQNSGCNDCGSGHCGVCAAHGGSAMLSSAFDFSDISVAGLDMDMADGIFPVVQFSFLRPPILI